MFLSVLNILMKEFDFVTLLAQLDAQEVPHGKHAYPTLAVNDRQVTRADKLHPFKRLMRSLIAIDYRPQFAGDIANFHLRRIATQHDDAPQHISLGKNSEKLTRIIKYTDSTNILRRHKLRGVLH